jgi:ubiquinone/menaquinone biosynthesis C-methylase UbiE
MGALILNWRKPQGFFAPLLLSAMNLGHLPFIKKVLAEVSITSSDTVLDIGCGGGNAISIMAKSAGKVYGMDHSPECVKKAIGKNKSQVKSGRVVICERDACRIPFEDGMFDLITAFETVYFWPDIESAFMEIRRKLKPSGAFLVACEACRPEGGKKHFLESVDVKNTAFRIFERREIRDFLSKTGFANIRELSPQKPHWLCLSARK